MNKRIVLALALIALALPASAGYIFDNVTRGWTYTAWLPSGRDSMGYTTWSNNLYLVSGNGPNGYSNSAYRFNGTSVTDLPPLPVARSFPAAFFVSNALHVAAGGNSTGFAATNAFRLDGSSWTSVSGPAVARRDFACAVLSNRAYIIGGADDSGGMVTNVDRFDGVNWTPVAGLPASRYCHFAATLGNSIYVMAGLGGGGSQLTDILRFDGTSWTSAGTMPQWRYMSAVFATATNIYVIGGMNTSYTSVTNIYSYDGTTWTELTGLDYSLSRLAAGCVNGTNFVAGGGSGSPQSGIRYFAAGSTGVTPTEGLKTGGFRVTIMGSGLGNGSDITNVTLCDVRATNIVSQSATQVVVWAGAAGTPTNGAIRVYSTSQGVTVKSNAFTYTGVTLGLWTTNWAYLTNGAAASTNWGTDFGVVSVGSAVTTTLYISEDSNISNLTITGWQVLGSGAAAFTLTGVPSNIETYGYSNLYVRFAPAASGVYTASVVFTSDAYPNPYVMNLLGRTPIAVLEVRSPYGAAIPTVGIHTMALPCLVTNSAGSPDTRGATQYVCSGWSMTGHSPATGSSTQFVMTVTNDAVLTWLWTTNYWLAASAGSNGALNVGAGWQAAGVATQITASGHSYYHFTNWSGDVAPEAATSNPLTLVMSGPRTIAASFAPNLAAHGTPEWWLAQYGWTNNFDSWETNDTDKDDFPAWQEQIAGTDPTVSTSFFQCLEVSSGNLPTFGKVLRWNAVSGRVYSIDGSSALPAGWFGLASNLPPTGVWTDTTHGAERLIHYRLGVKKE